MHVKTINEHNWVVNDDDGNMIVDVLDDGAANELVITTCEEGACVSVHTRVKQDVGAIIHLEPPVLPEYRKYTVIVISTPYDDVVIMNNM